MKNVKNVDGRYSYVIEGNMVWTMPIPESPPKSFRMGMGATRPCRATIVPGGAK